MKLIKFIGLAVIPSACFVNFVLDNQTKNDVYGVTKSFLNSVRAGAIVGTCVYDYTTSLSKYEYNTDEYHQMRSKVHSRTAQRILYLSETNRGIYLKAGQYIGNLDKIMPREYTEVLKCLQDSGPYIPFEDIRVVIDHDIKKVEELFSEFEKIPIAAASLAQVHKAKLLTGEEVAVKVQFPSLRTQHHWDLFMVKKIAQFLNELLRWNKFEGIDLIANYNTFSSALIEELDFTKEVDNAEKTREFFKNSKDVYIPINYKEISSNRLIVQEFVKGIKINDKENIQKLGLEPLDCANILINTFGEMIFKYGHIHCDAHPGNILIRNHPNNKKKPQLILLDHGFYRSISNEFRLKFSSLWKALVTFNDSEMKRISYELGIGKFYEYLPLIFLFRTMGSKKKLGEPMTEEERKQLRESDLITFEKINHLMQALPPDMLFVIRASNLIAIHNATLGGTTRNRLLKFTDLAFQNVYKTKGIMYYWAKIIFYIRIFLFERLSFLYVKFFPTSK